MNMLCAVIMIYTMTGSPLKTNEKTKVELAIKVCKADRDSNGCLESIKLYKDSASIRCGKR